MSLLSVIVPSYNRASLIRRCYDSVAVQVHRPLEFLLADDASTDDTAAAVAALPQVPGITVRYLRQDRNRGVSAARNLALKAAQGTRIALLDSDDVWFQGHLQHLLSALEHDEGAVAYARGEIRESPESPPSGRTSYGPTVHEEQNAVECLYYFNFILPSVTVMPRVVFEKAGLFDEHPDIQHAEDWDLFLRVGQAGFNLVHVPEVTAFYTTPAIVPEEKKMMMLRRCIYCLDKHRNYTGTPSRERDFTRGYYRICLGMALGGQGMEARACFRQALALSSASPILALPSLWGFLLAGIPAEAMGAGRRISARLFRRLRAHHRRLRGFPDPWD